MNTKHALSCTLAASIAAHLAAQNPQLAMSPAVVPSLNGVSFGATLQGPATGSLFAIFADLHGGPVDVLGERLYLSLSPAFTTLAAGVMPFPSIATGQVHVPLFPGLAGLVVYGQAIVLDPTAPNGVFRVSNGASTAIHSGPGAIVAAFDNPLAAGYTGNFASDVAGHVRGGAVTRRVHDTGAPSGVLLNAPLVGPMTPFGGRGQFVYPATDLAATGEPELITAIRWAVFSGSITILDTFPQFQLRAGHTDVVPDFTIDPFSLLPVAPASGLSTVFAENELPGAPPVLLYQGAYTLDPAQIVFHPTLPSIRYLPFPMFAPFEYDGTSSLLLDVRVPPSNASGMNGAQVRVRVQTSPYPAARAVVAGTAASPVNPATVTTAMNADNAMIDLQIEFTRVQTFALSPWLDSFQLSPDYGTPVVAQSLPPGTSVLVEYRGSASALGASPTAWSASPNVADGQRFLQFRITFHANPLTDERPLVDTLVVPLQ
jgi:hypothetical protein